ncbi:hypothetical protein VNO78_01648 [Psophocarpus tetragonolobus]|uniref:Pathogen-related protein n=1 Tax=Psophocarpus tetragonolobus TaxID=3891 RepID=A0AAN9XUR4_PSOTE
MTSSIREDKYRPFLREDCEKNTKWRYGEPPTYDVVNRLFEEGRSKVWAPGSVEEQVQTIVKTWEMEMFHKVDRQDYRSLDIEKYSFSVNGRKGMSLEEKTKLGGGGYIPFLETSLPKKMRAYDPYVETADTAHVAFTTAFPRGFALEILDVYSGPPLIVYKFRHWGYMEGPFKGHAPTGHKVELYGISIFTLDENSKIVKVEFFFDPAQLLGGLLEGAELDGSATGEDAVPKCPILRNTG